MDAARLTTYSHGAGCACKLDPSLLEQALASLTLPSDERLLVGSATGDDAAVWQVDDHRAVVFTTDFFTPVVDDARTWGRIAATNAISDVYAMGGRPLLALNLVAWNSRELAVSLLAEVLAGAASVGEETGFVIVGGHSVDDPEPKFGLAVLGEVDPANLLTNSGLRPGQSLVLTKPLGTGVVTTAIKRGQSSPAVEQEAVEEMTRPNAQAAEAALAAGATGATDVTGFGLVGHLWRMARESRVEVVVDVGAIPMLSGVSELIERGMVPGGTARNLDWVGGALDRGGVDEAALAVVADPQTSGGLLFGADPAAAARAVEELRSCGHRASVVGEVSGRSSGTVRLVT